MASRSHSVAATPDLKFGFDECRSKDWLVRMMSGNSA